LDWLQTFILQVNVRNSVDEFSKVLISFQGVFYTLLLAAVYLPARKIIFDRAKTLPISKADEADKQSKLETAGFISATTTPFKDLLPRIAALLAPLLIGPIADLVGKIFD
jgi:cbb3-type cytochrome oxidase subunit 3